MCVGIRLCPSEVFHQYLDADQDQNDAAGQFCFGFVFGTKDGTDLQTGTGKQKSGNTNKTDGRNDLYAQEGKGDTHGQGINARGNRKQKHGLNGKRRISGLFLMGEGLFDHIDTDQG